MIRKCEGVVAAGIVVSAFATVLAASAPVGFVSVGLAVLLVALALVEGLVEWLTVKP